jgi:hypothetical protein
LIKLRANGEAGIRAPKVGNPAETSGARGDGSGRGSKIVNGPGQNFSINGL